jgi:hypothetical protein
LAPPEHDGFITRNRFVFLFGSLLIFLLSVPVVQQLREGDRPALPNIVEIVSFFVMLAAAVVSVTKSPSWKYFIAALGFPAAILGTLPAFLVSDALAVTRAFFAVAFLGYVMAVLLLFVFSNRRVTLNILCAALCVYLLLGFAWAIAYSILDILDPSAIVCTTPGRPSEVILRIGGGGGGNALYFSLCTLTTLGYGDIVPVSPVARMLAALESVIGQLYLAVLVARLVGLQIAETLGQARD